MNTCSRCRRSIPSDVPEGACPICLIDEGLEALSESDFGNAAVARPRVQEQSGRYESRGKEFRGGQGKLLLVYDVELNRDVIMKELLPPSAAASSKPNSEQRSASMASRFLREARITGQLEHPSVVPVHEMGQRLDGTLYYTMKYVRGQSMETWLRNCSALRDRLALISNFLDLAQGVAYAHSRGVVHRDLKPHNVMIGEFGETVIIDWGLAKILGDESNVDEVSEDRTQALREISLLGEGHTIEGEVIGTPAYMSPEQAAGLIETVDERSDVYALGCILYRILTGKTTFTWTSAEDVLDDILNVEPPAILSLEPNAPQELVAICNRCLEKAPDRRYQNAKELATEIERFQTGSLVASYDYNARELVGKFYRRHKPAMNVALASVAVLLMVAMGAYFQVIESRNQAITARDESENRAYISEIRLAQSKLDSNEPNAAKSVLDATSPSLRGWEWGFLKNQVDDSLFVFEDCIDAALSLDGLLVATITQRGPISVRSAVDGSTIRTLEDSEGRGLDVQFSPDGSTILSYTDRGVLRTWDTASGEPLNSWALPGEIIVFGTFNPSSERIVCLLSGGEMRVYDLHQAAPIAVVHAHAAAATEVSFSRDGDFMVTQGWGFAISASGQERVPEVAVWAAEGLVELWREKAHGVGFAGGDRMVLAVDKGFEARSIDGTKLWERANPHAALVNGMTIHTDHSLYSTTTGGDNVRIYSGENGELVNEMEYSGTPADMYFSEQGRKFVVRSISGPLRVFNADTEAIIDTLRGHSKMVREVAMTLNGALIVTSAWDNTVRVWRPGSSRGWRTIASLSGPTLQVDFSIAAGRGMASNDGRSQIFDLRDGSIQCSIESLDSERLPRPAMSADGSVLAIAPDRYSTAAIQLNTRELLAAHLDYERPVTELAVSDDGRMIASACRDGSIHVWSTVDPERRHTVSLSNNVTALELDKKGKILAIGCENGDVLLWQLSNSSPSLAHSEHDARIYGMKFAEESSVLYSATGNNGFIGWDLKAGEVRVRLNAPPGLVQCFGLNEQGTRLFAGNGGRFLGAWDLSSGDELLSYSDFHDSIVGLEYDSEHKLLYVAMESGAVVEVSGNVSSDSGEVSPAKLIRDSPKAERWTFIRESNENGRSDADVITLKRVAIQPNAETN